MHIHFLNRHWTGRSRRWLVRYEAYTKGGLTSGETWMIWMDLNDHDDQQPPGGGTPLYKLYRYMPPHRITSQRSRRLEIVATRKNVRERRRHACLPRARLFSLPPTTSKPLLRRLRISGKVFAPFENGYGFWKSGLKTGVKNYIFGLK